MSALPAHLQPLISRLTAWQRNQWARAGYPLEIQPYLALRKPPKFLTKK